MNRVEEYNIGKHRSVADQYLALGFGTKGETLKKNYVVTLIGEEEFDNRKTVVLELTPKSDQARAQISRIRMWIDEASWLPVQQKFFETGSDDYFLSHYTHVMKNLKLGDGKFKPDWPKSAKVEKPRGKSPDCSTRLILAGFQAFALYKYDSLIVHCAFLRQHLLFARNPPSRTDNLSVL